MADASPVRLPAPGSAQRVAVRVLLAGALAALLEVVGFRLSPDSMTEAWPDPSHAAYWATFAASIPLVARACEATRGAWRVVVVTTCGAYLAPIACFFAASRAVALAAGGPVDSSSGWTQAGATLVQLVTQWPPYAIVWFGHPAAFLIVYLLGSGFTPRVPAPAVAFVASVVQAVAHLLFCGAMYRGLDLRWFDWRASVYEGAWAALAVLSAGLGTWLEARLAVGLTARREERARRG